MTITDVLTFVGIAVSIIFGFIISHFCSIRDTRTRVIKDYYIEEVKNIKKRIDDFFHEITFGKSSFRNVVDWYDHLAIDIDGIDQGVRKSLDMHIGDIIKLVDNYYNEITSWENFNNQYTANNYLPSVSDKQRLKQMKFDCDEFLNDYISQVNQSNAYPIWKDQWSRILNNYHYFKESHKSNAAIRAFGERLEKHLFDILMIFAVISTSIYLLLNIEPEKKEDLYDPLKSIADKQDSIHEEMRLFREKYKPVEIQSKSYRNSSFFNANKVDSVQIKLYQGRP